jgi:hypothetical protein
MIYLSQVKDNNMRIKKVTEGYVIQVFNTETQRYESQEFVPCGLRAYYDADTLASADLSGMQLADGTEPYLPFDMVQPKNI